MYKPRMRPLFWGLFIAYCLCIIVYFLYKRRDGIKLLKNKGLSVVIVSMLRYQNECFCTTV